MKLMVIDDMQSNLEFFQDILKDEFSVHTFLEPITAIENIAKIKPDLVLLDYVMPELSGHEVLKIIKSRFPRLPVIVISGFRVEDYAVNSLEALADDFIFKPIFGDELIARIKNKIEKCRRLFAEINDHLDFNLKFNDEAETVFIDDSEFQLKGKEYRLLKYLVENKNQLVTREDIFMNVWQNVSVSPATLDTHLCQLRKKLDKHGDKIVTRKNSGFLFSTEAIQ